MYDAITQKLEEINYFVKKPGSAEKKNNGYSNIKSSEDLFAAFVDLNPQKTKIVETVNQSDIDKIIENVEDSDINNIINLRRINDIVCLEEFLSSVNKILPLKGIFICYAETTEQRYKRIIKKNPKIISYPYYTLDFVLKRLFPKWGPTKKIYDMLTKGNNRALSLAHILGLFTYYGFKVNYLKDINDLTYFVFEKVKRPSTNCRPLCGVIFKMERIGKNGKIINLYKLRTMHPYSECIQQFTFDLNGSKNGDKITDDFRVASWGRIFRKYWIDELPMLLNLLKGDVKLVGVRPLSRCKFNLYPPELQKLRILSKPGLIPPFYADLPKSFDELLESERKYLNAYMEHPIKTDVEYFFKCSFQIIIKRARSA